MQAHGAGNLRDQRDFWHSILLALDPDFVAITLLGAMPLIGEERVVAVRSILSFLYPCPFTSSLSTNMADIAVALWTIGAYVGFLRVFLLDVNKFNVLPTCNLDCIAVATCAAMRPVSTFHFRIVTVRTIFHPLPGFICPMLCSVSTSMAQVIGIFGAVLMWITVLWECAGEPKDRLCITWSPHSTIAKIPTHSARIVATIDMTCLGLIRLIPMSLLLTATIFPYDQPPRGASIAVVRV